MQRSAITCFVATMNKSSLSAFHIRLSVNWCAEDGRRPRVVRAAETQALSLTATLAK